ncbi:MAG TPA: terminase gpA endonuclease subunit [Pirellulales bacterium]|jgi:hypothetical protein|nr:terminase gpA endonuclease subunit [Pirellulales bacterium]
MPVRGIERERDAARKVEKRRQANVVVIPRCANLDRRTGLEADDKAWLQYYFGKDSETPDPFWYAFTWQQTEIIDAIASAIIYVLDQAIAASRGEGKTTLAERLLLKYALQGVLPYAVLFQATGALADNSLDTIKTVIEENPLLLADYPEVCVPVRALENTPNRAHYQRVSGHRHDNGEAFDSVSSKFTWCGQEIIFPKVPGSPSTGAIIATRGLDSAIRGLKKRGKRPRIALIDDPDTEETARSEEQAKKLEEKIDRSIGGLGNQQAGIGRIMLTTLPNRKCTSARFTDPSIKPTWKGKRFRFLVKQPARSELWADYVAMRAAELESYAAGTSKDQHCRSSHSFYLENKAEMEAGAEVANPHRFNATILPDGSQTEVSALQRYYNEVAKIGQDAVSTEYDNNPPEETGPIESGITANRIQRQLSGLERKKIPAGCVKLTRGIDCRKVALHWVVRAWRVDGSGFTIDYGVHEVKGTKFGTDEGLDAALRRSILEYVEESKGLYFEEGAESPRIIDRTLIDAGWRTDAVYSACETAGLGVWPVMGFGKSAGCTQANFSEVQKKTVDRQPGDGWFLSRRGKLWLVCADADRWKAWEHDRWMTSPGKPGCMMLFGQSSEAERMSTDEKAHFSFAKHICNEIEVEDIKGRRFVAKSENTHWLDASYYSDVAASMEGIRIFRKPLPARVVRPPKRKRIAYL